MMTWAVLTYVSLKQTSANTAVYVTASGSPSLSNLSTPLTEQVGCPWFIYAFGAAGAATFITASTALLGTALRSVYCVNLNVFLMCLVLTAQACLAVAFFVDHSWEHHLPPETSGEFEKVKKFIMERLEVCKWVGVGVFLAQLLTLLLSCALQSAYVRAEEAAEDEADEAATRRRPLLQDR